MGYAQDAQVQIAAARKSGDPAALAAAYASMAVLEAVCDLHDELVDLLEELTSAVDSVETAIIIHS